MTPPEGVCQSLNPTAAVSVRGLGHSFGDKVALKDVSFDVAPGTVFAILGPNGAGKSTTIRCLSTLLLPDTGAMLVAGFDVAKAAGSVRERIALAGQSTSLDQLLTGFENLVLFARLVGLNKKDASARATALLRQFGLEESGDKRVATYSGGMERRLDLAVSLVGDPLVVLLDEPTTGLDPRSRLAVWRLIRKLCTDGVAVVLTTQYLEEAEELADTAIVMDRGTVLAAGSPGELKSQVGQSRLRVVFNSAADLASFDERASGQHTVTLLSSSNTAVVDVRDEVTTALEVLRLLDEQSLRVKEFVMTPPTLEETFLALTDAAAKR